MAKRKRRRISTKPKAIKPKLRDIKKEPVDTFFEPLVLRYKKELEKAKPSDPNNYVIDIYTKWHLHYFYFCQKHKAIFENRIDDEFEVKFVRLEYVTENNFNFSYLNEKKLWHLVMENISLTKCLELMNDNPNCRPVF